MTAQETAVGPVETTDLRLLEGPNLYFTRPAVKISLSLPGYLGADEARMQTLAAELRLPRSAPGEPGTETRGRFLLRLVERVVRRVAKAAGSSRLGVRVRTGTAPGDVVVAVPWNSRARAAAIGEGLGPLLAQVLEVGAGAEVFEGALTALADLPPTRAPRRALPKVPVIAITGTNGKTTTTRLVAHIGMTAGLRTGWSSTDGVLVQGELIEEGDYSGPAGARAVLDAGVQLAVLETARGGMLRRGLGTPVNDVSVVTNVSADHLGEGGIETLDQLAEVKAIITRVTKPAGWTVLNGDDPRVWAMRTGTKAHVWCFTPDPDSPSLREAVQSGGRGITVLDGDVVILRPGHDPEHLLPITDIPMTLAGLSHHNVANALAGAAGALGLGVSWEAVVEGLRTFTPDARLNPGRMNVYTVPLPVGGAATMVLDMAHNESGLDALLTVAEGIRLPGRRVVLGLGTGGDRTDDILRNLGEMAGLRADLVHIEHKEKYLRGRTRADLTGHFEEGLTRSGVAPVAVWDTELEGVQGLLAAAQDGDVLPVMVHEHQALVHGWLLDHGGTVDDASTIRDKVLTAQRAQPEPLPTSPSELGEAHRACIAQAARLVRAGDGDAALVVLDGLLTDG